MAADECLKTIVALLRKQPLTMSMHVSRTRWICDVIGAVRSLLDLNVPGHSVFDVLRLFRVFPRITDVDVTESVQLFQTFLQQRAMTGTPPHTILQQVQVMKLSHANMTRADLKPLCEGVS